MKQFIYRKLNAFSKGLSGGNPAAYLYLNKEEDLTDEQMQYIATEHKGFVSEVIYCFPLGENLYRLRYYSSECEVEFCGHGTIACMYDLINNNEKLKKAGEVTIRTNKGNLTVYNELESLDAVFITAPEPEYLPVAVQTADIASNLGISDNAINYDYPVLFIDAGLRTLIVPIGRLSDIINIRPDEPALKDFCLSNNIDIILVFTNDVINKDNKVRTRVFAPKFGYLEDFATGSGNSAMGYYMLRNKLWGGEPVSIEQNGELEKYNIVKLKTKDNKVLFGGNAIIKIKGDYFM
jgi:PhzF family phenazine biosynthesis protein